MDELDNLKTMFQTFMEATQDLQKTQTILQKKVEDLTLELEEKNRKLRKKERLAEIGSMAASIAHEIRNPLGGIELFASLIKRTTTIKEQELCDKILSGVSRLNRIVEDLLNYAKDFNPIKEIIVSKNFVDSLKDYIQADLEKHRAELKVSIVGAASEFYGDRGMLFQVFLNLLKNAAQAVPNNGIVYWSFNRVDNGVLICVEDNGEGVREDICSKIFQPFFTTKSTGSGLGLAIVHRFIEAHNGQIVLKNSEFGGAKFEVFLPENQV